MVKSCLVATCRNTLGKPGITFHKIGKRRYADRLKAIGRSLDDALSSHNVICSDHYAEQDFIFFNGRKYLRLEATPRFSIPRKPVIKTTTETILRTSQLVPDESNISTDTKVNISPDIFVTYTDLWIFTPQSENSNEVTNQDLPVLPSDDFPSVLSTKDCESLEFDVSLDPLES